MIERMTVAEINALLYSPNHARDRLQRALQHLEYRNAILIAMVEKLGVSLDHTLREGALNPNE